MPPCPAHHDWVFPRPSPDTVALFENTNRDSSLFLRTAGIPARSVQHKALMKTVRTLHRQYMHPFKYLEEQASDCVDQLIAKAQIELPWLNKYEEGWPARIYLKRYVDTRRPHLMRPRHVKKNGATAAKCKNSIGYLHPKQTKGNDGPKDLDDTHPNHDSALRKLLRVFPPNLEHRFDAFVRLGIKDNETVAAFLSWPEAVQAQFLDEGHGVLQLTSLERRAFLVRCGSLTQQALGKSLGQQIGIFVDE